MFESKSDPDDAPDMPIEPVTLPGDIWYLGPHRLVCGDSTRIDPMETLMGSDLADICWTDPPDGLSFQSSSKDVGSDFRQFLVVAFASLYCMIKPGGVICVAHSDANGLNFRSALTQARFKLSEGLVWTDVQFIQGYKEVKWQEWGLDQNWGSKEESQFRDLAPTVINEPKRSDGHPTMKPVALIERMLRNSARSGDIVLDLFGGSGTTLIAAERLGMHAYLMELDPRRCDLIVKRYEAYTGRKGELDYEYRRSYKHHYLSKQFEYNIT